MVKTGRLFRRLGLAALVPCTILSAAQAEETEATLGAYAAGYVANFTCSATFNGGKSWAQIKQQELHGIYPLIADAVAELEPSIDSDGRHVQVRYRDDMPPRISVWRPALGCVDLPVGATLSAAEHIAGVERSDEAEALRAADDSGAPWSQHAPINGSSDILALDEVVERAFSRDYGEGARTTAVLVANSEAILSEHYIGDFTPTTSQRTWSVAKSIGASVIGAAVQQDLITTDATGLLDDWSHPADPRAAISLENLLQMSSGLDSNRAGNRTDRVYMGGGLVADTAVGAALERAPGERWKYANNDTMLALRALRERFDNVEDYLAFPFEQLLDKIGMHHTHLETDWQGDFILSSQVWTTSRDLARLGLLHLQNGRWHGEQILPENWLEYVSHPASAQPESPNSAGNAVPGYGAQWWLFNDRIDGIPNDTIAARGNRGQFLIIVPSRDLIIVRRGHDIAGEPGFDEVQFTRDVLATLP
ncbi:serine hydrolase domain-containing protein [Aliidiomarina sp. Khilg15.8]